MRIALAAVGCFVSYAAATAYGYRLGRQDGHAAGRAQGRIEGVRVGARVARASVLWERS